jgi:Spy/CpxP family protein refolding chaperone
MKRVAFILGLILLVGRLQVFAQSVEDEVRAKIDEVKAELALAQKKADLSSAYALGAAKPKTPATDALQTGLKGTWWREASWIKALDLTPEQRKKMDDAFLQNRIRLVDLTAALEKEELLLEPLVESVRPEDEAKIVAQIDKVADARAGLEKANARMLLAFRQILTQDQWNKLQANRKKTISLFGQDTIFSPFAPPEPPVPPAK